MLQYVNPMAINTWAIAAKYPDIRQVGLCHSVQGTALELARDLDIPVEEIRYRAAGINHMAFYLNFEHRQPDGSYRDLYPALRQGYREGRFPKPSHWNPRCPNKVRYEMMTRLGYFVTESSEHFAEYTPWFIKRDRPDLIEKFGIPLDEYPKRCIEQIARWEKQAAAYRERQHHRGRGQPGIRQRDRQLRRHRRALGDLRQLRQPRLHPAAARRLRRRGPDARRRQRPPADRSSATSRRSSSR